MRLKQLNFVSDTFQLTFVVVTILSFHLWFIWQTRQGEWLSRITNKNGFFQIKKDSSHALLYYIFFIQYIKLKRSVVSFIWRFLAHKPTLCDTTLYETKICNLEPSCETTSRSFHGVSPGYIPVNSTWCTEQEWLKYLFKQTPPSRWLCEGLLRSLLKKIEILGMQT